MGDNRNLEDFRSQLDQLDRQIVSLLASRFDICRNVARFKKERGISMMQPARVQIVKQQAAERARIAGVSEDFILSIYTAIIAEACRLEDAIIDSNEIDFRDSAMSRIDTHDTDSQPLPIAPGGTTLSGVELSSNGSSAADRT